MHDSRAATTVLCDKTCTLVPTIMILSTRLSAGLVSVANVLSLHFAVFSN